MKRLEEYAHEYTSWCEIKRRCYKENRHNFKYYGGKGIKVCDRWLSSFENFLTDMGNRPSPEHTLDRINSNGDYEPSNCRWATKIQQANNTSQNINITYRGITQTLAQWCRQFDLPFETIKRRIRVSNWNVDKAFTTPIYAKGRSKYAGRCCYGHDWGQPMTFGSILLHVLKTNSC